jgi:hypothetical protein
MYKNVLQRFLVEGVDRLFFSNPHAQVPLLSVERFPAEWTPNGCQMDAKRMPDAEQTNISAEQAPPVKNHKMNNKLRHVIISLQAIQI